MDEEDSQDELINRNASHGKGKRPAVWAISDEDSDGGGEESEGVSDSGGGGDDDDDVDDEEDNLEDDDDDEEDDDSDDGEEEDAGEVVVGAVGGVSSELADLSSDEDTEKCPICLNSFHSQPVATPESCEHYFCLDCILEWSKNANSCPVDRKVFNNIYLRKCYGGKVQKMITVQKPVKEGQEEVIDLELEQTSCEVCGGSDREDRLLLCDGCDAGYHMECLTPPLDAVPVEEWFCPECLANGRHLTEEQSDTESLGSTRPTTSRSRPPMAGPTRAIARTQQSERVRASVNRHRITQARTAQITPSFLMPQSTWLDETINAVVAGLNTAVYIRDLTPRAPSSRTRRTVKRRKGKSKRSWSATGGKGKAAGTGLKRKKRRGRRTKSRRKLVVKKEPTSRGRIARSLGIGKPQRGSSLPSVYRPTETSLGSMRADIGAASLSVYGDPYDLDPFTNREDEEEQAMSKTSLLEAKRRGLSRSALRSHQPVARPITAGLSRRGLNLPQVEEVVEAAPVPDLLGSILSGQSMLLMDSSDVIINRDGSLKAIKPGESCKPGSSRNSSSGESVAPLHPGMSPNPAAISLSLSATAELLGGPSSSSSHSSPGPCLSPVPASSPRRPSHSQTQPPLGHPRLLPAAPRIPSPSSGHSHWGAGNVRIAHKTKSGAVSTSPSTHDSHSRGWEAVPPQPEAKKAAPKPVWEAPVSLLPRIPKIKRESGGLLNGLASRGGSSCSGGGADVVPEACVNSLAGNRGRHPGTDRPQQQGRTGGQIQRPDRAGSASTFSSSFSSTSSSGSPANPPRSFSASSSSTVCFRINTSGSVWHARQVSNAPAVFAAGDSPERAEEEKVRRKREKSRSTAKPPASDRQVKEEEGEGDMYDPFHPTGSDSNASDSETDRHAGGKPTGRGKERASHQLKAEVLESSVSLERDEGSGDGVVKGEPEISHATRPGRSPHNAPRSGMTGASTSLSQSQVTVKRERNEPAGDNGPHRQTGSGRSTQDDRTPQSSSNSGSCHLSNNLVKTETKSEHQDGSPRSLSSSKSHSRPSGQGRTVKEERSSPEQLNASGNPETDRRRDKASEQPERKRVHQGSREGGQVEERRSWCSQSRERRRSCSSSDSSISDASERSGRKKRRSSSSIDRRRSRSESGSSSRERSKRRRQKRGSWERNESRGRERNDSRGRERGQPSKDKQHRLQSRSRSRERRKDHSQPSSSRSKDRRRSQSRERRKEEGKRKPPVSSSASSSKDLKEQTEKKKAKATPPVLIKQESETKEERKELDVKPEKPSSFLGLQPASDVGKETDSSDVGMETQASISEKLLKESKLLREIKIEKSNVVDLFEDSLDSKPIKKEKPLSMFSTFKDLQEPREMKKGNPPSLIKEACSLPTSDMADDKGLVLKEETHTEPICPELSQPLTSNTPALHRTQPGLPTLLPLNTNPVPAPPQPTLTPEGLQGPLSPHLPVMKALIESKSPVQAIPVKREVDEPLDNDNEDMVLDCLDSVKIELVEPAGESGEAGVKQEKVIEEEEVRKTVGEVGPVIAGAKAKPPVKRVTWNLQEPEGPQPEKTGSKLAIYKLKLKQEGARRPAFSTQASSQETPTGTASLSGPKVLTTKRDSVSVPLLNTPSSSNSPTPVGVSKPGQREPSDGLAEHDAPRTDKYIKKLHMQERAIEEVKLAIKPFYQKRDITKDEYKEIVRKAVQKVCHSKSGEINPVKVANLIKAYVDKYKHARKHRQAEDGKSQEAEIDRTNEPETP
ncbi:PHD and RING finger domain-containing protein 1 isoform X2 [Esox lucius]|uniref:PHD and ring finger domains 1 n=1 Tax=Esox lucius TaxID=8010 RepID=A0A3P8ZH62_ESOLU|nr:PHD and RING finger domain-containing protein 1 isoform X2 [Esox lucius]